MQLFNVWVEPLVEVMVHLSDQKDAVVIEVLVSSNWQHIACLP